VTPRRACAVVAGAVAGLLLLTLITLLFVPNRDLRRIVERAAAQQGFTLAITGFGKAFPLGIKARRIEIANEQGALLVLDSPAVRLSLLPLLAGKVQLHGSAHVGGGVLDADVTVSGPGRLHLAGSGMRIEEIPWFQTVAGAQVMGKMGLDVDASGPPMKAAGSARVEVKEVDLKGINIHGVPLPDAGFDTVRGALKIAGGTATLESFALQGPSMYVRLKGTVTIGASLGASPLAMTLEMMPKPAFLEDQKLIFLLLARYLVTPGQYAVPITGTLASPIIR